MYLCISKFIFRYIYFWKGFATTNSTHGLLMTELRNRSRFRDHLGLRGLKKDPFWVGHLQDECPTMCYHSSPFNIKFYDYFIYLYCIHVVIIIFYE